MKKYYKFKLVCLVIFLTFTFIFIGNYLVQAQGNGQGKGKPPKCNNNGICEEGESKDCPDCIPKVYPPLVIDHVNQQIASSGFDVTLSKRRVRQYKCVGGSLIDEINKIGIYEDTWASDILEVPVRKGVSIGDADNDGMKEIVSVGSVYRKEKVEKGRQNWQYQYKIYMFEDGSNGPPDYSSDFFKTLNYQIRDSIIADADTNGDNEFIVSTDRNIVVHKWNENISDFEVVWTGPDYGYGIFNVEVGDADNDGQNEIVLAMFDVGSVFVLEYLGSNIWSDPIYTEEVTTCDLGSCRIDMVRVKDVDNDGHNEIIAGGNNSRLMVWKYSDVTDYYDLKFVSDNLGGFTQGLDSGDINGDGLNEIAIGASIETGKRGTIYVFEYEDTNPNDGIYGTYLLVNSISFEAGCMDVAVGDLDQDGIDEVVHAASGLRIFDFIGIDLDFGYLQLTYHSRYGGSWLEIH